MDGILAAAGPGIRAGGSPDGSSIVQLAATILRLHGLATEGIEPPIEGILETADELRSVAPTAAAASESGVYSDDEEARILERLRDLGYE